MNFFSSHIACDYKLISRGSYASVCDSCWPIFKLKLLLFMRIAGDMKCVGFVVVWVSCVGLWGLYLGFLHILVFVCGEGQISLSI